MSTTSIPLPTDYAERVYAGVLGKIIGVYLGRPFEQWSHKDITARWGEINRYVHADQGVPLVITDDDITGTFTFLRALVEHGVRPDLSSREIGQTWLNQIAEGRHILWWGGIGNSAEHTAYLRLLEGVEAPRSGSTELNGTCVSEEIGAQIFIDGWALVAPGNPDLAVRLATEAARVSHDGEAVYGAQVVAALVSQAFVEHDLNRLLDQAVSYIPPQSEIARLITDLRRWRTETYDWREGLRRLVENYGYARYGTNCPMVSNHGVIHLALLWGDGDFDRSLMIANTAGYDTDCNAGNVGCILGVRNGLAVLDASYDWRTPVNDRLFQPAADGHRGVTDASAVALEVVDLGRALAGQPARASGAPVFSFPFPGSTHGFVVAEDSPRSTTVCPVAGGIHLVSAAPSLWADTETDLFLTPATIKISGYAVTATPRLYTGQTVRARVVADSGNSAPVTVALTIRAHAAEKSYVRQRGPVTVLAPGANVESEWIVPSTGLWPIGAVGLGLQGQSGAGVRLEWLDWFGLPPLSFMPPKGLLGTWGTEAIWETSWVGNLHHFRGIWPFIDAHHNRDGGLAHTGAGEWADYTVEAELLPWVARRFGIAARVQGLTRHVSLVLHEEGTAALVRQTHDRVMLASVPFAWERRKPVRLKLRVAGPEITGSINGVQLLQARDEAPRLATGGVGLLIDTGRVQALSFELRPE